jgi:hypothetical protein
VLYIAMPADAIFALVLGALGDDCITLLLQCLCGAAFPFPSMICFVFAFT